MNNTVSLEQISETVKFDFELIIRQYNLEVLARFKKIKSPNLKLRQYQIAKELGCSGSNLQRYRHDINMLSHYRILSNCHKRRQKTSSDLKRPQMTSIYRNVIVDSVTETIAPVNSVETKNKLKGGGNIEIND